MLRTETFVLTGIMAFVIPVIVGGICYAVATVAARRFSPSHAYSTRLLMMLFVIVMWWAFYLPAYVEVGGGPAWLQGLGPGPITLGSQYGAQAIWAWFAAALFSSPKRPNNESHAA